MIVLTYWGPSGAGLIADQKTSEKKTDKQMPLQFQMEEIVHRILLAKLDETEICYGRYELSLRIGVIRFEGACEELLLS